MDCIITQRYWRISNTGDFGKQRRHIHAFGSYGMSPFLWGNFIVPSSTINFFFIYLDKSFLDGEPEILRVNFAPGTVFQLQDAELCFCQITSISGEELMGLADLTSRVISFSLLHFANISS